MKTLLLALSAAALAAPASAGAATVTVDSAAADAVQVHYVAGAGEANRLTVVNADDFDLERITFTDPGATITASGPCTATPDGHSATCARTQADGRLRAVRVELGDGDDTLDMRLTGALSVFSTGEVLAGPGDDVVTTGQEADHIDGGGGTDALRAGEGSDTITDGDTDANADADVIDGGPARSFDRDEVSYATRQDPVTVDLAAGTGGARGEGDRLTAVRAATGGAGDDDLRGPGLTGGPGDDRLRGTSGGDYLAGGAGDDVLDGRGAGKDQLDELYGGAGRDRLASGAGDSQLGGGSGFDRVSCGRGDDDVLRPAAREVLAASCERLFFQAEPVYATVRPTGRVVGPRAAQQRIGCYRDRYEPDRYRGTLTLRERGGRHRLVGRAAYRCGGDEAVTVRIRLTARGARLVQRRAGVLVAVRALDRGEPDLAWSYRLKGNR